MIKLAVEPINGLYRIVVKGTRRYDDPILYSSDLPLETTEDICRAMEELNEYAHREGYGKGYEEGWKNGMRWQSNRI